MTVRIVTDSSCDLNHEESTAAGIEVVPLTIRFGSKEFIDREELSVDGFYTEMAASTEFPETAAPAPGAFEVLFRRLIDEGASGIVCINISSELSATFQSARTAANSIDTEVPITVIDSLSITGGLGTQVLLAAQAAKSGANVEEITKLVNGLITRTHVIGVLDTLDNLKKGGRIGGAAALLGSMLSIKPAIDISTGSVLEAGKPRTRKKAVAWLADSVLAAKGVENLAIMHGNAPDHEIETLLDLLSPRFDRNNIRLGKIGAVIGTHGGPRVIGACFLADS